MRRSLAPSSGACRRKGYMAEQRGENSVLFSLKELRRIEEDRVAKEQAEARARLDAERRAREDAERRAREEEERRIRDEQDRIRRAEEDKLRAEREEQLRIEEAERRARVEGEMRLQEQRMRLELAAKKDQKSALGPVIGVAVVLVAIGGGIVYKLYQDSQAEKAALQAKAEEDRQRIERQMQEEQKKFQARMAALQENLTKATSDAEKERIRAQMVHEQQRARTTRAAAPRDTGDKKPSTPAVPKLREKNTTIDDDPLGGLK